jgi:hypothetical protein
MAISTNGTMKKLMNVSIASGQGIGIQEAWKEKSRGIKG